MDVFVKADWIAEASSFYVCTYISKCIRPNSSAASSSANSGLSLSPLPKRESKGKCIDYYFYGAHTHTTTNAAFTLFIPTPWEQSELLSQIY